jgi:hypothetical protein
MQQNIHQDIYKSPQWVPFLIQINQIHPSSIYLFKIDFKSFSHLSLGLTSDLLLSDLQTETLNAFLIFHMRTTCPAHLIAHNSIH